MTAKRFFTLVFLGALVAVSPMAQAMPQEQDEPVERERGNRPPPPDLREAAEKLGISEQDLHAAIRASGGPPPN